MKTAEKIGIAITITLLVILFVYAQETEFEYTINYSELPVEIQETITVTAQPNSTIVMAYDLWLSGENQIYLNNTNQTDFTVNILVPENTTPGNYTKYVFIASTNGTPDPENITFHFNIFNQTNNTNTTLVDLDNDTYFNDTDCDDNNPDINPGQEEIPYNGIDDDCNPDTEDNPDFSITTDQAVYDLGEQVIITIQAANHSNITLDYSKLCTDCGNPPPYQYLSSETITNGSYPTEHGSAYNNVSGSYRIEAEMQYRDTTLTDSISYVIENTIDLEIDGDTSIKQGESILLEATATGGISPYEYTWILWDDSTEEGEELSISFDDPGKYNITLNVIDAAGNKKNKTFEVSVRRIYTVIFYVRDSSSGSNIAEAEVDVEGEDVKLTNSDGKVTFYLTLGTKDVTVWAPGYSPYITEYYINSSKTYTINLDKTTTTTSYDPQITIIAPADAAALTGNAATFTFKVEDDKTNNCSLYFAEGEDNWFSLKQSKQVSDNQDHAFTLDGISDGSYRWKIECVATDQKSSFSQERSFTMNAAAQATLAAEGQVRIVVIDDLVELLTQALNAVENFDSDQNTAAIALDFEKKIEDALDLIDKTGRDIADLSFRRDLDEQQKEEETERMIAAMDALETQIPIGIQVKDTKKFVKYIRKDELEPIVNEYLEVKDSNLNSKRFLEVVMELQKKMTVSTTAQIVTLSYIGKPDQTITLVIKDFEYSDDIRMPNATNNLYDINIKKANYFKILEHIPKDIAQNVDVLNFTQDHEVLKADPLVQIAADERLVYYILGEVPLDGIKQTNSILIDTSGGKALDSITGASIFEFSLDEVKNAAFIILIIVVIMLAYFAVTFKWTDKVRMMWFLATSDKQLHYVRVLINDVSDHLQADNYEKAAFLYTEIKLAYEKLSVLAQNRIYGEIVPVFNQLDIAYLKSIIDKINVYIKTNQLDKAQEEYTKLRGTYHMISPTFKKEIYPKVEPIIKILGNQA